MDSKTIRLIVFDIDGVLTNGEAQSLDLRLLEQLAGMNQLARTNPDRPAVTLCSGRPAPYVEMMLQAIDGHLPAVFENGAGLYVPDGYRFLPHPELADEAGLREVRSRLQENLVLPGRAYFQPGKEYSLTLFANKPEETDQLYHWTASALGSLHDAVDLVYSSSCLNILPRGIHKGKGIHFLAEHTGTHPAQMLGVGDSDVDLQFLALVGFSAAPSNSNPEIKQLVQYVASRPTSDGVRDILDHFNLF